MVLTFPYLKATQTHRHFSITRLPARLLVDIVYAAVRGVDKEQGAIQRVLNASRISSIRDFALKGGDFPNAFVLNWVAVDNPLVYGLEGLSFVEKPRSAQIIDGQHRIAGIRSAILEDAKIGDLELPVVIYSNLNSRECADIFLSINTEQKPVPPSLVFDLFGIASEDIVDPAALRARDIAMFLHTTDDSPYLNQLKLPGSPIRKGGIALSTAVTAIKPIVENKGALEQIGVSELEVQRQVILNLFKAIQLKYKSQWSNKDNVFLYAGGFVAALQFFEQRLLPYCNLKKSFQVDTIFQAMPLEFHGLIWQSEVKNLSGSAAVASVFDRLVEAFSPDDNNGNNFLI